MTREEALVLELIGVVTDLFDACGTGKVEAYAALHLMMTIAREADLERVQEAEKLADKIYTDTKTIGEI